MTGIGDILRQAKEMQGKLAEVQEELGRKQVKGFSGGGMVTVTVNGRQEVLAVKIEPAVFESGDIEMLQDLVAAAANDALSQAKTMLEQEMSSLAGGFNLRILFQTLNEF